MSYEEEFPMLRPNGLYAAEIRGDGNCLFNALSDQLYGHQGFHSAIRSRVVDHVTANADYYSMFLEVYPGGGTRRNPKRKTAGASSLAGPSAADTRRVFQEHVARMARGGVWGDNMEIQAFTAAFDWSVKIYQFDMAYVIPAPSGEDEGRTAHIAYHTWEHYSSIRNTDGPFDGPPQIKYYSNESNVVGHTRTAASTFHVPESQVKELMAACPESDKDTITLVLQETRGDSSAAYEKLMNAEELKSNTSDQSSSMSQETASADDASRGPNKRQDRKLSRISKGAIKSKLERRNGAITSFMSEHNDSLEDLVTITAAPRPYYRSKSVSAYSDSDEWIADPLGDGSTSSDSEYSSPAPTASTSAAPIIKIKLSMVKTEPAYAQQPPKLSKHQGQMKKPMSNRDKKAAQKLRAEERKRPGNSAAGARPGPQEETQVVATTAMKTLYI